jgi:hypothetical protein
VAFRRAMISNYIASRASGTGNGTGATANMYPIYREAHVPGIYAELSQNRHGKKDLYCSLCLISSEKLRILV